MSKEEILNFLNELESDLKKRNLKTKWFSEIIYTYHYELSNDLSEFEDAIKELNRETRDMLLETIGYIRENISDFQSVEEIKTEIEEAIYEYTDNYFISVFHGTLFTVFLLHEDEFEQAFEEFGYEGIKSFDDLIKMLITYLFSTFENDIRWLIEEI